MAGKVIVVSSPIGNLEDVSPRARAALEAADLVACEDTRRSGRLLAHLGLKKRLLSMHEHNEARRLPVLLAALEEGRVVAVLSDAGTPLLSDPGYLLVPAAHRQAPAAVLPPLRGPRAHPGLLRVAAPAAQKPRRRPRRARRPSGGGLPRTHQAPRRGAARHPVGGPRRTRRAAVDQGGDRGGGGALAGRGARNSAPRGGSSASTKARWKEPPGPLWSAVMPPR